MLNRSRYSIVKFLLRENISNIANLDEKIFRVFETMDYVVDVPFNHLEDIQKRAEETNLIIQEISTLPVLYQNPFKDYYRSQAGECD